MKIYLVITEGVMDCSDSFVQIERIFLRKKRAIKHLKELVEEDKRLNPDWYNSSHFIQHQSEDLTFFEIYEDGYYCDNHFTVQVKQYNPCRIFE